MILNPQKHSVIVLFQVTWLEDTKKVEVLSRGFTLNGFISIAYNNHAWLVKNISVCACV